MLRVVSPGSGRELGVGKGRGTSANFFAAWTL